MNHPGFWRVVWDEGSSGDSSTVNRLPQDLATTLTVEPGDPRWAGARCCFPAQPTETGTKNICLRWCQTHQVPHTITRLISVLLFTTTGQQPWAALPAACLPWAGGLHHSRGQAPRRDRCPSNSLSHGTRIPRAIFVTLSGTLITCLHRPIKCLPPLASPLQDSCTGLC